MQHTYYIDLSGIKDGPHTLVTIMRRIRTGKVKPDTLIYTDGEAIPKRASDIEEISLFFTHDDSASSGESRQPVQAQLSVSRLLRDSWQFTIQHSVMSVYAG